MEYQGSQLISLHICSVCGRRFSVPYKSGQNWGYVITMRRKGKLRSARVCSYSCQRKYVLQEQEKVKNKI